MNIDFKTVTRFIIIMYEVAMDQDYGLIRVYQDSSEVILVI